MKGVLRDVVSADEEWRTSGRRGSLGGGRSYGRVCLWIRLVCMHCHQRMVALKCDGSFAAPKRLRCSGDDGKGCP